MSGPQTFQKFLATFHCFYYPRQNGLAVALRELGRLERLYSPSIGCRTSNCVAGQIGLNKGEAKNALARGYYSNRLYTCRPC